MQNVGTDHHLPRGVHLLPRTSSVDSSTSSASGGRDSGAAALSLHQDRASDPGTAQGQHSTGGTSKLIEPPMDNASHSTVDDISVQSQVGSLSSSEDSGYGRPIRPPRRSASLPPPPPKSAMATPLPHPRHSVSGASRDKRAHFDDDLLPSAVLLERTLTDPTSERTKTISARMFSDLGLLRHGPSVLDETDDEADEEIEAALGVFEEVIEELVHAAQDHEEASEQLAEVA